MEKILTITVPTYNMEAYLDECLSSMVMEDASLMEALEVIVVNDGSKDNSLNIALSYKERYPNTFVVIDKENGNYGSCVNRGLKEATGKFFRIVDADDWVDTNALEEFIKRLEDCQCDLVFTDYSEVYAVGKLHKLVSSNINANIVYDVDQMRYEEADTQMQMHGMTYRTAVLYKNNLSLSEGVSYTDTEYCFYPLNDIDNFIYYDIILYQYRASRDGQTMSIDSLKKSINSLYVVSAKLVQSISGTEDLTRARNVMRYQVLNRMLRLFYMVTLSLSHQSDKTDKYLEELYKLIVVRPLLLTYVRNYRICRVRYVRIWEKTGLYNSTPLFVLYNSAFNRIKWLLKTVLKLR